MGINIFILTFVEIKLKFVYPFLKGFEIESPVYYFEQAFWKQQSQWKNPFYSRTCQDLGGCVSIFVAYFGSKFLSLYVYQLPMYII